MAEKEDEQTANLIKMMDHIKNNPKPNGAAPAEKQKRPPTPEEVQLALAFVAKHKDEWRHVAEWGAWLRWTGKRWEIEKKRLVANHARIVAKENKGPGRYRTFQAIERIASSEPEIAASGDQWDCNLMQINTPDGTVCLRTGKLLQANPIDYCTKITGVGPGGKCERWMRFLDEIFDSNEELIRYMQKMLGYNLTGSTKAQQLWFLYGTGANGKSVLLSTVTGIFADYAATAAVETFTTAGKDHETSIADLQGARLVTVPETEEGRGWREAEIKRLTGSERVRARHLYQSSFYYMPQFKLIIAGNHKPALSTVDEAMRRRMNLVPFSVTIPEDRRDPELFEKLKAEWPGILQWMIEGCLAWQKEGLDAPQIVKDATNAYLENEDFLAQFEKARCEIGNNNDCNSTDLYQSYKAYAELNVERVLSQSQFSKKMEARGYLKKRTKTGMVFEGICLKDKSQSWSSRHDYD